ncbi:hypothetical protein SDC9_82500 [bioreactor metagenome]|uniref:Uncharacterized protein n=1 Tax=bioreactor metagenome TaxID=1076179 RepID=A0A644Z4W2_9ZZZZ
MIYLVREHEGSYEDYRCYVIRAFCTKPKAEAFIEKYNIELQRRVERSNKCEQCPLYWAADEVKNKDLFIEKSKKKCPDFACQTYNNGSGNIYLTCHETLFDIPSVDIKEIELE